MSFCAIKQCDNNAAAFAWDNYVEHHPEGSLYHLYAWRALISNVFGHRTYYLYAQSRNEVIAGVLPLVQLKSRLFGNYMVSMPYFNYGGVLASTPETASALQEAAETLAKSSGVSHIEYRDSKHYCGYAVKKEKVNMHLVLPEEEKQLWKALGSKLRAQIKRPLREHPEVKIGGVEMLSAFYKVFALNMRDLGTPVYPQRFFAEILRTFPVHSRIIVIFIHGEPAAAGFLLGYKNRLEIPWASSSRKYNKLGVNMLLYWEVLKFAIDNGYHIFDFGRSSIDSGTYRFKKQWGAEPKQLYLHYWLTEHATVPELNPDNPKYKWAIRIWRRLPVRLTCLIGPQLVKNLP